MPLGARVFGALFDVSYGRIMPAVNLRRLKFLALFYEHILVLDGALHCYGPAFDALSGALYPTSGTRENIVGELLKCGAIIPAIRSGDSIRHNWENGLFGAVPGKHLVLPRDDKAKRVLDYIDTVKADYVPWPDQMSPGGGPVFAGLLHRYLVNDASPHCLWTMLGDEDRPELGTAGEWKVARALLARVLEDLSIHRSDPAFRRGAVEDIVKDGLGRKSLDYAGLAKETLRANCPLSVHIGVGVLDAVSTVQQAWHSSCFQTFGTLIDRHDGDLAVDVLQGVGERTGCARGEADAKPLACAAVPLCEGAIDIDSLTARRIGEIRESEEFQRYLVHLREVRSPTKGEMWVDANKAYVDYLEKAYLPYIVKQGDNVGIVRPYREAMGFVAALASIVAIGNRVVVSVGGEPVFTWLPRGYTPDVIALAANALTLATAVDPYLTRLRGRRMVKNAMANNYRYWAEVDKRQEEVESSANCSASGGRAGI